MPFLHSVPIAWSGAHFGEEPPISGVAGSGTVFFAGCDLACVYCQNHQISQNKSHWPSFDVTGLAQIFLELQKKGAHNLNLVSPTIWFKQIKSALLLAKDKGLLLPVVWNSNGAESIHILRHMNGLINIYLPDFKYSDNVLANKYSRAPHYLERARASISEMFAQVGVVQEKNGIAKQGLIVRHLVLPGLLDNSFGVMDEISLINRGIAVSLMRQYTPHHRVFLEYPELNRVVTDEEFGRVCDYFWGLGMKAGWVQDKEATQMLNPDFEKKEPFSQKAVSQNFLAES